jgi:acetyl esterase/lipase
LSPCARALAGVWLTLGVCAWAVPAWTAAGAADPRPALSAYRAGLASARRAESYAFFGLDEDAFLSEIARREAGYRDSLERFLRRTKGVPERVAALERARIRYWWADVRLYYGDIGRRAVADVPPGAEDPLHGWLAALDRNDPGLLEVETYRDYLRSLVQFKGAALLETIARDLPDGRTVRTRWSAAEALFRDARVRGWAQADQLIDALESFGDGGIDDLIRASRNVECDSTQRAAIDSITHADRALRASTERHVYARRGALELEAFVVRPDSTVAGPRPALVVFHGGGFHQGKVEWSIPVAQRLAAFGMVGVAVQYRLVPRHGGTAADAITDAKSAMRWVRAHARELGVDPHRLVAAGWSAGGLLCASAAMFDGFNATGDDTTIDARPNAMVLWYPVVDTDGDAWFASVFGGVQRAHACSPAAHVRAGLPPAIIFQGTEDADVPFWKVRAFSEMMQKAGNRCDLHLYEDRPHLFMRDPADRADADGKLREFLMSTGMLPG